MCGYGLVRLASQWPRNSLRGPCVQRKAICCLFLLVTPFLLTVDGNAQESSLPAGFQQLDGKHITLITDIPLTDAIRELPRVFDAAVDPWCKAFAISPRKASGWRAEVYLMRARERFTAAGFLPTTMPDFPYGFQWGNRLWVSEQATDYYNRHLLLHEGTHWIMSQHYNDNGPPWLMEGLAEWYATHRWESENLQLAVIPQSNLDVAGWGRISLIQQQLSDGVAPTLETILRYDSSAHQQAEAYAWSWAAVVFLKHHPDTRDVFAALLKQDLKPDMTQTRWLFSRLRNKWPNLRTAWNATLTDLEYGFDLSRELTQLSTTPLPLTEATKLRIDTQQGWQASGRRVEKRASLSIVATGEYQIAETVRPWISQPDGVTLEYYRGQPLGKLMIAVMAGIPSESATASLLEPIPAGARIEYQSPIDGELFFRINEPQGALANNKGVIEVTVTPTGN